MKGEIMVIRRATYKAESAVQGLEKDKGRQDLFIDGLMDQVKRLQEEVVMSESKIGAQQGQTKEADDIMRDTAKVGDTRIMYTQAMTYTVIWRSLYVEL
jgi:hypothetical protein